MTIAPTRNDHEGAKPGEWRVLRRDVVHDGSPWLTLSKETLELPDGRVVDDFYQLAARDFVVILAFAQDGRLITTRQYKHGPRRETVTFPGGMIEEDEAPVEAAGRELLEETGFIAKNWHLLGQFCVHGNLGIGQANYVVGFDAEKIQAPNSGDLEDMKIELWSPDQLRAMIDRGEMNILHHVAALGLLDSLPG